MSTQLNHEIDITLKPSLLLLGLIVGISMMTCLILVILPISFYIKLLMIFIVVISTTYLILRDVLLLMPWSWQRLQVNHLGELNLFNNHHQSFAPKLKATTFIHPLLIILDVKESKLRTGFFSGIPMVLITSQMDKEQHRQLRVWLRWWKHEGL